MPLSDEYLLVIFILILVLSLVTLLSRELSRGFFSLKKYKQLFPLMRAMGTAMH